MEAHDDILKRCEFCQAVLPDHEPKCRVLKEPNQAKSVNVSEGKAYVTFEIGLDTSEAWVDPNGVAWYAKYVGEGSVHFERKVTTRASVEEVVRFWRRVKS